MYRKSFPILLGFLLLSFTSLQAQEDIFAFNNTPVDIPVQKIQIESQNTGNKAVLGERMVHIPVNLNVESDVKLEIRDALGYMLFESETTYPEGDREIRIGIGGMEQGLYFIRVATDLDEKSVIVLVERPE